MGTENPALIILRGRYFDSRTWKRECKLPIPRIWRTGRRGGKSPWAAAPHGGTHAYRRGRFQGACGDLWRSELTERIRHHSVFAMTYTRPGRPETLQLQTRGGQSGYCREAGLAGC